MYNLTTANKSNYLAIVAYYFRFGFAAGCEIKSFPSVEYPRVTITFGDSMKPYHNSFTLDCDMLSDSGTEQS